MDAPGAKPPTNQTIGEIASIRTLTLRPAMALEESGDRRRLSWAFMSAAMDVTSASTVEVYTQSLVDPLVSARFVDRRGLRWRLSFPQHGTQPDAWRTVVVPAGVPTVIEILLPMGTMLEYEGDAGWQRLADSSVAAASMRSDQAIGSELLIRKVASDGHGVESLRLTLAPCTFDVVLHDPERDH